MRSPSGEDSNDEDRMQLEVKKILNNCKLLLQAYNVVGIICIYSRRNKQISTLQKSIWLILVRHTSNIIKVYQLRPV
jgi:hypothetical protein